MLPATCMPARAGQHHFIRTSLPGLRPPNASPSASLYRRTLPHTLSYGYLLFGATLLATTPPHPHYAKEGVWTFGGWCACGEC